MLHQQQMCSEMTACGPKPKTHFPPNYQQFTLNHLIKINLTLDFHLLNVTPVHLLVFVSTIKIHSLTLYPSFVTRLPTRVSRVAVLDV